MPFSKKPRRDVHGDAPLVPPPPPRTRLAALRPKLRECVLRCLVHDDCLVSSGGGRFRLDLNALMPMLFVSKEWCAITLEAASARLLKVVYVPDQFENELRDERKRSDMLAIRHEVILRRAYVERLVLGDSPDYGTIGCELWAATLSHAPQLKTLELDAAAIEDRPTDRIADVVRAAARHCAMLEKLTTPATLRPPDQVETPSDGAYMRALLRVMYDGLNVWSRRSGGLRHLQLPLHSISTDAKRYMDNIITHCPHIRTHRLCVVPRYHTSHIVEPVEREDAWELDLETWDRFCRVCDQLEELDWRHVPFATKFFEVFANHQKPKLRSLTLVATEHWVWDKYFETIDTTTRTAVVASGYGASARRAEWVLRATPNLEALVIEWPDSYLEDAPPATDPDIFGDAFVEAVARSCKNLKRFTHAVTAFSDRSMRALATLPHLEWAEVVRPSFSSAGLFDLVVNHASDATHCRQYLFSLGDYEQNPGAMAFYDVLEGFLERLVASNTTVLCETRRVSLQLENVNYSALDNDWSAAYFGKVRHLAQQARTRHPSIQLRGLVHGYRKPLGTIQRIGEFVFATETAAVPAWKDVRFSSGTVDAPIDDAFVAWDFDGDDLSDGL